MQHGIIDFCGDIYYQNLYTTRVSAIIVAALIYWPIDKATGIIDLNEIARWRPVLWPSCRHVPSGTIDWRRRRSLASVDDHHQRCHDRQEAIYGRLIARINMMPGGQ